MKHVVWNEQSDEKTLGPGLSQGINQARAALLSAGPVADANRFRNLKGDEPLDLAPSGGFDAGLRRWVKYFQVYFNRSRGPAAARAKARLPEKKLIETGEIDYYTRLVLGVDESLARDDAIQIPDGIVARQDALTASELKAAPAGTRYMGSAYRVEGLDKLLDKLGLGERQEAVSKYRVAPLEEGKFIVPEKHPLFESAGEKDECAALVQCLGVSNTRYWRRGPRVQDMRPQGPEPGTVIATLGKGVYYSDYSGQSHVGIFLMQDRRGLVMLDQFVGGNTGIRRKPFSFEHKETHLRPSQFLGHAFRREVTDKSGNKIYGQDYRYDTVRTRTNLTSDGSEYYILLDDGKVARHDDAAQDLKPTKQETKQVVKELVDEIFGPARDILGPPPGG